VIAIILSAFVPALPEIALKGYSNAFNHIFGGYTLLFSGIARIVHGIAD
jgi:hypothetical protein